MNGDGVAIVGPAQIGDPDCLRGADVHRRAVGVWVTCRKLVDQLEIDERLSEGGFVSKWEWLVIRRRPGCLSLLEKVS